LQKNQRFVADQRLDLPQYESMIGYIDAEFNAYNKAFISPLNRIAKNWIIENNGGLQIKVNQTNDSLLFNSERTGFEAINYRKALEAALTLNLADNATNYVEVQLVTSTCAPDTVAIWDTTANGGLGEEFTQTVDTGEQEEPILVSNTIAFSGALDKLPLAIVTTSGGVITLITDAREMLYSLDSDWLFGSPRTDRTIGTVKDAYDALATAIKEIKGSANWYDAPFAGTMVLKEYQNLFFTDGGNIEWEGTQGANTLGWSSAIGIEIADRASTYTISAGTVTLAEGQAAYVIIPPGAAGGPLPLTVAALSAVPIDPASAGYNAGIQVLFFRRGGKIYGMMDIPELSSGEVVVIGQDLSNANRTRLGITGENAFTAYSSTAIITSPDSYPVAISKLDLNLNEVLAKYFGQLQITPHASVFKAKISGCDFTLLDTRVLSQEVSNLLMEFDGAVINFSTGVINKADDATPLGINFTPFAIPVGEYFWYGIGLVPAATTADNRINVQVQVTPATAANAVAASAPKPVVAGKKKLGSILFQNIAGVTTLTTIRQLGVGSGSGGTGGSGSPLDPEQESQFTFYTRSDFNPDVDADLFIASITGALDKITAEGLVEFTAGAQVVDSIDLTGPDVRADGIPILDVSARLLYSVGFVDTAPVVTFSRDGGLTYVSSIETRYSTQSDRIIAEGSFIGTDLYDGDGAHGATAQGDRIAAIYTPAFRQTITSFELFIGTSSVVGTIQGKIEATTAGVPNGTVLRSSSEIMTAGIDVVATRARKLFSFSPITLEAGVPYAIIAQGTGLSSDILTETVTGAGAQSTGSAVFAGTWTGSANDVDFETFGTGCDLRIKITSSMASKLKGFGVDYALNTPVGVAGDHSYEERIITAGEAATGLITFGVVRYTPGSHQLQVTLDNHAFDAPDYAEISPTQIQFDVGDVLLGQTLRARVGFGLVDGSSEALALLAQNKLGHPTSPGLDKSVAGEGLYLRSPNGTLYEVTVDDTGNIVSYPIV
jgi:hypothetical protein